MKNLIHISDQICTILISPGNCPKGTFQNSLALCEECPFLENSDHTEEKSQFHHESCTLTNDQVNEIKKKADNITTEKQQIAVSEDLTDLTKKYSNQMKTEDVKATSEIINKLIDFSEKNDSEVLNEEVRANIMKTIDTVQEYTPAQQLAKDGAAHSLRDSVKNWQTRSQMT